MNIKEKIQKEAVHLFNTKGFASVTMRQIAESLGMSPGNLTYHYKAKADIIRVIYKNMHREASDYITTEGYITLHDFELMMERFNKLMKRYHFFFDDVVHITRQFPAVARMYEESNLMRFKQGRKLIDYYIESGRMKPESGFVDYNKLVHNIWMISAFWSSQEQVIPSSTYNVNKTSPVEMAMQLLFPHLTAKGIEEYHQIRKFIKLPHKIN